MASRTSGSAGVAGQMVRGQARCCIDCRSWRVADTGSAEMLSLPRRVIGWVVCRTAELWAAGSLVPFGHTICCRIEEDWACPLRMRLFALMG